MSGPVIRVEDLVKRYDGRTAVLDGVSFSVEEGEFVIVYGKSGCGKTTLLNMIGGLDRPTSGSVRIDGQDISGLSEDALSQLRLRKIGFVFQDFNLLTDLTVRENVALPLRFSKKGDGGRVDKLLREFDIYHIADELARRISGGEAQRTAIARAMVNEPRILLADEPTGNLDEDNTQNIMDMFHQARSAFGTTTVLATHDLDLAERSTSMMLLESGRAEMRPTKT
ncbi:MAG: ABC transporter ATP-binding protein [Candidatus Thermoplasmatota archaeon]|nr:ABC transporter ATP-binding protein [Candidatus Thermoplasmatota archaeon]